MAGLPVKRDLPRDQSARLLDQRPVARQITKSKLAQSASGLAQQFAGPAQFRVGFGNAEAVTALVQHQEPLPGFGSQPISHPHAVDLVRAPADAPALLVQLRQAGILRVLDRHTADSRMASR
jgi:hypothetical protein